jgi:hypothetical protein
MDNVTPLPMNSDAFQRTIVAMLEKYLGSIPKPMNPESQLWDMIVQSLIMGRLPTEEAIEAGNAVIEARRKLFGEKT